MARLEGGIFSRPRGKTGGVVFGAARTREGKMVTSRLLVSPSNPNTAAQQAQRGIFKYALWLVRTIGSAIYRVDWNRAISQLPGFQSLMSVFMNNLTSAGQMSLAIETVNLGTLDVPDALAVSTGSASGELDVTWGATVVTGSASDTLVLIAMSEFPDAGEVTRQVEINTAQLRSGGSYTFTGLTGGAEYVVAAYCRGAAGSAYEGMLSPCQFDHDVAHV
jgi:hypothetical protein